jgi:peptidoglycan/xylan/chitin deacetylase (PgdA/CDA1 family)
VPSGAIALSFDDGYVDNYTNASPVLVEFGLPAVFFITTDRLDEDYEFWWDTLERILVTEQNKLPAQIHVELPGGQRTLPTLTAEQRLDAYWEIYGSIAGTSAEVRDEVINRLKQRIRVGSNIDHRSRRMTRGEIVALSRRPGHTIGAHSVRHLMLPQQPVHVQRDEIRESKHALEAATDRPVFAFAYPFGAVSDATASAVRDAAFEVAVTCEDAPLSGSADVLRLPRLRVTCPRTSQFDEWLLARLAHV